MMWFKNLKIYTLSESFALDEEQISERLGENAFRECGKQELASMGWISPIQGGADLIHAGNKRIWLTLKKQERLLPASVVNAQLEEKIAKLEQESGSPVGKKQKQDLKQEITHQLLPQAFTKNSTIQGVVCLKEKLVLVDTSSDSQAEVFLAMLRKALGSLPVLPITSTSVADILTDWLKQDSTPAEIEILNEAEFKADNEDASVIRCKNQDLYADEILNHLENGKWVTQIGISWDETLTTVVDEQLTFKRLKFTDVLKEQNDDIPKEQIAARQDADFALISEELIRLAEYFKKMLPED